MDELSIINNLIKLSSSNPVLLKNFPLLQARQIELYKKYINQVKIISKL